MSAVFIEPDITPADRLGLTLCFAIIVHAIIVLGITFAPEESMTPRYDMMEVVLVQQKQENKVEDAKLLAQASLEGGGESTEELVPGTPLPPPFPDTKAAITAPPEVEAPPPQPSTQAEAETDVAGTTKNEPVTEQLMAQSPDGEAPLPAKREKRIEEAPQKQEAQETTDTKKRKTPTATQLLANSFKIASLSAEVKRKLEAKAARPKRTFISASTKEYRFAAYMEAWRAKVERIGNLNYPEEARKRKLNGSLILDVALNPDGTVNQITVRKSSGHKILDDAAIRIVHLASPFAPFPDNIKKDTDILHITRTWQFLNNQGFR